MSKTVAEVRTLKVNRYIIIDDEPCKIVEYSTSKPGKHGEAKARIVAIGVFDGRKRSIVHPVTHKVQVPIIDKRNAQVIAVMGNEVQLMDLETYETFNVQIPEDLQGEANLIQDMISNLNKLNLQSNVNKLKLGRLEKNDVNGLVKNILNQNVPDKFVNLIFNKSEGNPLYVEEIIKSLLEDNIIDPNDSGWFKKLDYSNIRSSIL